jgi:hypothetical protein
MHQRMALRLGRRRLDFANAKTYSMYSDFRKEEGAKFSATAGADPVALDLSKPKGDLRL